jgi:hypothetical protein
VQFFGGRGASKDNHFGSVGFHFIQIIETAFVAGKVQINKNDLPPT